MLIIKNHVCPPYGLSTTQFHYIPPLDPCVDVIRADTVEVPYVWRRGKIEYIDTAQFDALDNTPIFCTPAADGADSVRGLIPHIVLVLGKRHYVFGGFPAGATESAGWALRYVRMKLEESLIFPEKDIIIDFSQALIFDPEYLITLCPPKEAKEILRLTCFT